MSAAAVVRRGVVRCSECDGRLVGYADVTLHPTILVRRGGRLALGPKVDNARSIKAAIAAAAGEVFGDELMCEHACGYTIPATTLRDQFRGGAERAIAAALGVRSDTEGAPSDA